MGPVLQTLFDTPTFRVRQVRAEPGGPQRGHAKTGEEKRELAKHTCESAFRRNSLCLVFVFGTASTRNLPFRNPSDYIILYQHTVV